MEIRSYHPNDYDSICEISKHIWGGSDYLPFVINKYYEDPHSEPIVLEIDGEIVSVANTRMIDNHTAWLEAIRTHPKASGKGYGLKITEAQLTNAKKMKAREAQLLTGIGNKATRRIMEKLGFEEIHLYCLWGWNRSNFEEYQDKDKNETDREGKLISIRHLGKFMSSKGRDMISKIMKVSSIDEVIHLLNAIKDQGFDSLIVGDYQSYSPNAFLVEKWIKEGSIFKIDDPPAIITIQEGKESKKDNITYAVGVTSVDSTVIESAMNFTFENYSFNHIELMFSEKLEHRLFSIPEFRFRLMRKFL